MSILNNIFEQLEEGYVLVHSEGIVPVISNFPDGACALVFSSKDEGLDFLNRTGANFVLPFQDLQLKPIKNAFELMKLAAGQGMCGLVDPTDNGFKNFFLFMTRVEEAGHYFPTVLSAVDQEIKLSLIRTGVKQFSHSELFHWRRYDVLDPVSAFWSKSGVPFRDWEQGNCLYELCIGKEFPLLSEVSLIGDWISVDGAYPLFTTKQEALHFASHLLEKQQHGLFSFPNKSDKDNDCEEGIRAIAINDLIESLQKVASIFPFTHFCINPGSHRENSAYGYLRDFANPDESLDSSCLRMYSVAGTWQIHAGNHFELIEPFKGWNGKNTIGWSGGQALQLMPIGHSLVLTTPNFIQHSIDDLTDLEKEEELRHFLDSANYESFNFFFPDLEDLEEDGNFNDFYIAGWDAVTGDRYYVIVKSFFDALAYLASYERDRDRDVRTRGARGCSALGFSGSGSSNHEVERSDKFQLGLYRIGLRVLNKGYFPQDSENLVTLCNATLKTYHVEYVGYAKDLLWASSSNSEQLEKLLDDLQLNKEKWEKDYQSGNLLIDPLGKQLCLERMGEDNWELLSPKVKGFLSTALADFEKRENSPQLDYAPISIEVVKSLEVELGLIFQHIKKGINSTIEHSDNGHEKSFEKFLLSKDNKPPTLGQISYLLKKTQNDSSPMRLELHSQLEKLSNVEFLTSNKFAKKQLQRVVHKYRNGGAHDSRIELEVCRKCLDELIGKNGNPGSIPKVASWKNKQDPD